VLSEAAPLTQHSPLSLASFSRQVRLELVPQRQSRPEQAAFQQEIAGFAAERIAPAAAGIDQDGRYPRELVAEIPRRVLYAVVGLAVFIRRPGSSTPRNVFSEWFNIENGRIKTIYTAMFYPAPTLAVPNWPPYNGNWPLATGIVPPPPEPK